MSYTAALSGFLMGAGLIIAIGAQNAFVLRQGLKREHVGLVVAVCVFGDVTLILLGVAGIGTLVQRYPLLLQGLRFGGAAFLATYAFMAARRAWLGHVSLAPSSMVVPDWRRTILACLAFTFLNPHVYLDTMVLLGSISTRYPGASRWAFAGGACLASISWFTLVGYGARVLQPVFRNPVAWQVLDASIAIFMGVLCLSLLFRPLA